MARVAELPHKLTIVIVGEGGVGKSSVTLAYVKREFNEGYDPTIEDSYTTQVQVDGTDWTVEVLDTAGQEEYRGLWEEQTVSEGQAFIVTYDISSRRSFDAIPSYLHTIRRRKHEDDNPPDTLTPRNTPFVFAVAANKCDLPPEKREVATQEGAELAKMGGGLFFECSAKEKYNVSELFESLIRSTAKVRAAEQEHARDPRMRGVAFNRNVGLLESRAAGVGFDEKATPPARTGGHKDLAMDRRRSQSIGGLGREARKSEKEKGGCCVVS